MSYSPLYRSQPPNPAVGESRQKLHSSDGPTVLPRHRPVSSLDHPKNVATLLQSDLKLHCICRTDRHMRCTHTGSSGECNLRKPGGHTPLTNSTDDQRMIVR